MDIPAAASHAFDLFVALTSSDGFETLLSHLGPDPKVGKLFLYLFASYLHVLILISQEESLFLLTLGPRLGCECSRVFQSIFIGLTVDSQGCFAALLPGYWRPFSTTNCSQIPYEPAG